MSLTTIRRSDKVEYQPSPDSCAPAVILAAGTLETLGLRVFLVIFPEATVVVPFRLVSYLGDGLARVPDRILAAFLHHILQMHITRHSTRHMSASVRWEERKRFVV
jgi:hypothetical protein